MRLLFREKINHLFFNIYFQMRADQRRNSGNAASADSGQEQVSDDVSFKKIHQQYIQMKIARKRQIMRLKKEQFGSSSSSEDDFEASSPSPPPSPKNFSHNKALLEEPKKILLEKDLEEKYEILIQTNKINSTTMVFKNDGGITIGQNSCFPKAITKLKVSSELIKQQIFKIKITPQDKNEFVIGVAANEKRIGLPLHYYIYAKLLQEKLSANGKNLSDNMQEQVPGLPQSITSKAYKFGKLKKKSQHLGKWAERIIVINPKGLFSYKKPGSDPTMSIGILTVNEIETDFDMKEGLLIIKVKYGNTSTDFGLPLADFLSSSSWLYHFYSLCVKAS